MEINKTLEDIDIRTLILVSGLVIISLISIFIFLAGYPNTLIILIITLGGIISAAPYAVLGYLEIQELEAAEQTFPEFIRDLAQSKAAGMTLPQAIKTAEKTNYGKLSKYIHQLNIWLSWSIPFPEAWSKFTYRLRKSNLIKRVNDIIHEAFISGGNIVDILNALAEQIRTLKEIEADRRSLMKQHMFMMYIIFILFLGVLIAIQRVLVPILFTQQIAGVGMLFGMAGGEMPSLMDFKNLFLLMILVQGICAGLISGQITEDSVKAGIKHIGIMLSAGLFVFFLFIYPAEFVADVYITPTTVAPEQGIVVKGDVYLETIPSEGADITIIFPKGEEDEEIYKLKVDSDGKFEKILETPLRYGNFTLQVDVNYETYSRTIVQSIISE